MNNIHDLIQQPLSEDDLRSMLKNYQPVRVMKYSELSNYQNIQQLLPKMKDYVILLVEFERSYGHWVTLMRDNMNIFYFDSYGYRPDKHQDFQDQNMSKALGQEDPLLSHLLNKAIKDGFKVYFNSKRYQKMGRTTSNINTCGRHVVSVIKYFMNNDKPDFKKYLLHMKQLKDKYNVNYDYVVTMDTSAM